MLDTSIRHIVEEFIRRYTKSEAERWILDQFFGQIHADGGGYARNIESTGHIFYTAFTGIYQGKSLPYIEKSGRLTDYAIKNRTILVVNDIHNLPPGTSFKGEVKESERLMIIPIFVERSLIKDIPTVHGAVVLVRMNGKDFTNEEKAVAEKIRIKISPLIDSFFNALKLKKLEDLASSARTYILESINEDTSTYRIVRRFLALAIKLIDAAEKGSVLVETERGMKFIAAIGYDEEKLLDLPPLPAHRSRIIWYGKGEDNLKSGRPRIISEREIDQIMENRDTIKHKDSNIVKMKANLMIPIILKDKKLLAVNLDNFSGKEAFDDMDINIAETLSTYLSASYELITRRKEAERHQAMIRQLRDLISMSMPRASTTSEGELHRLFLNSVIGSFRVLGIVGVLSSSPQRDFKAKRLCGNHKLPPHVIKTFEDNAQKLYNEKKDIVNTTVSTYPYDILLTKRSLTIDEGREVSFILGLIKYKEFWTETEIHFVDNTIDISTLMAKNVLFLRAMYHTQEDTLRLLGKALEMRDLETKGHTERTAYMTSVFADAIGFPDRKGILWGAYVHDIGKIAIPDYILLKPGKLTKEEFEIMKKHVIYGYQLISGIKGIPKTTTNVVLYHHEKWDGSGYPEGLKGTEIPLEARIFAIIDVFDALISKRPYKEAWSPDRALSIIKESSGTHFDPHLVDVFVDLVENTDLLEKLRQITKMAVEGEPPTRP